ncbi:iron-sulfur cluster repair di-iron protein [Flavihumibacter sp. R14]|nr:iron-sulfur cluster repair di-iron protein [Flavihumibacter soli]
METDILDVTVIEPRFKHPTIFQKFDSLVPGNSFIIHNDHDPKPLYYQLLAERGQIVTWAYLESGPELWRVSIGKRIIDEEIPEETIGEIVARDYRKAQAFKKLGIDFCCGGKKTLSEVSKAKGISLEVIKSELEAVDRSANSVLNFDEWELDFLTDYVVNTHHSYCRESIPFILEIANKVARVHGGRHPELVKVAEVFARIAQDLVLHMSKEEKILFPFIRQLVNAGNKGSEICSNPFGGVLSPIMVMEMEHEQAGEDLTELRELTSDYSLPADACNSYTILFRKLEEFEIDLYNHVHLENNILFPKAIKLERDLLES